MCPVRVSRQARSRTCRPVLRNLLITLGYHRLTAAMAGLLGRRDYAWPIFATWASKQAGQFIRREELPAVLRMDGTVLTAGTRAILERIARYIVGGNTIVFAELGAAFAAFTTAFADPSARTDERLADLVAGLTEGPSLPDIVRIDADGSLVRTVQGGRSASRSSPASD